MVHRSGVKEGGSSTHPRLAVGRRIAFALLTAGALALTLTVMHPTPAPAASSRAISAAGTVPTPTTAPVATVPETTAPAATTPQTAPPPVTAPPTTAYPYHSYYPTTTYYSGYSKTTLPATTTTVAPTTTTTIAPLGGQLPAPPSTLPLTTKKQSGHVSPVFADLSGVGFFLFLVLLGTQAVLTRRGRNGPTL